MTRALQRVVAIAAALFIAAGSAFGEGPIYTTKPPYGGAISGASLDATDVWSVEDNITAFAGGGQGSAYQLSATASVHRVTTVASASDSVKLPTCTSSTIVAQHTVINTTNTQLAVFPATGESINAGAANAVYTPGGNFVRRGAIFVCAAAGVWNVVGFGVAGTTNQINVAVGTSGGVTLSLPQSIDTAATVQFGSLGLGVAASATAGTITGPASTGVQHAATATNDSAAAGQAGEYQEVNCGIPAASGTVVAFTNASPTVGTWTAHPFQQTGIGFSNAYACPFTITANAPTGLSTATNYWAVPIDANTFRVSTSAANAAAGTYANTSGSVANANLTNSIALSTTAGLSPVMWKPTAGDWDCLGSAIRVLGATTSVTNLQTGINSSSTAIGGLGTYDDLETAANVMTATNNPVRQTPPVRLSLASQTAEYLVALDTFTASTNTVSGFVRCRRAR